MSEETNYEVLRERRRQELSAASREDARRVAAMKSTGATDYAVRVIKYDGTTEPDLPEEMQWVSFNIAKKIAAKAFEARQRVVNSPVAAIEIINAEYNTVMIHRFTEG